MVGPTAITSVIIQLNYAAGGRRLPQLSTFSSFFAQIIIPNPSCPRFPLLRHLFPARPCTPPSQPLLPLPASHNFHLPFSIHHLFIPHNQTIFPWYHTTPQQSHFIIFSPSPSTTYSHPIPPLIHQHQFLSYFPSQLFFIYSSHHFYSNLLYSTLLFLVVFRYCHHRKVQIIFSFSSCHLYFYSHFYCSTVSL